MAYVDNDFINSVLAAVKTYLASYLTTAGQDVTVMVGYPDFNDKLPLPKCHISVTYTGNISPSFFGFGDGLDGNITVVIDVWTSRGTPSNPSKSGGETGANRIAALIFLALTDDQDQLFALYPGIEEIDYRTVYSRRPPTLDNLDLFQVNNELQLRVNLK